MLQNFKWSQDSKKIDEIKKLQKIFGELNYISELSRPDISFAVNQVARKLHTATKETVRVAKRIIGYLVTTQEWSLKYMKSKTREIIVYADSSFADVTDDKFKSTGGYAIFV